MKRYSSLAAARKSLVRQVIILTAAALLLCLAGRLMEQQNFDESFVASYGIPDWDPQDLRVEWDGKEVPVQDFSTHELEESGLRAVGVHVSMQPQEPGEYVMTVLDPEDNTVFMDRILVSRTGAAFSSATGSFTGDEAVVLAGVLYFAGLAVIMLVFFLRLRGAGMYSYEAILSFGVFLFSVVVLIFEIPVYVRHLRMEAFYPTWQLISDIAASGRYFSLLTLPVIFFFSVLLIISNIELLRHERPRIQNALGLLLGILLITAGLLNIYHTRQLFMGSEEGYRIVTMVENLIGVIYTYVECILLSSVVCGLRAAKHVPEYNRDYILILGCGFRKDGTLPPLLRGRVDKAMEFWHRQKEETGKEAVIIPTGGQGGDEPMPEAEAMYRYMVETGFPPEAILREDKAVNTYQNMEFSKKLIEGRSTGDKEVNTAFVTTNYHVFRSGVWAGLAGLRAEGLGSRTKWWFWPNAFVRECVGLLQNRVRSEILFLVCLIALFGGITVLSFM
ncbi:MAG: YdcF family protein [Blautia sp.]|nr:YdcF family protein [Blautia sp.]